MSVIRYSLIKHCFLSQVCIQYLSCMFVWSCTANSHGIARVECHLLLMYDFFKSSCVLCSSSSNLNLDAFSLLPTSVNYLMCFLCNCAAKEEVIFSSFVPEWVLLGVSLTEKKKKLKTQTNVSCRKHWKSMRWDLKYKRN